MRTRSPLLLLAPLLALPAPAAWGAPATLLYAGTLDGPSGPVDQPVSAVFTLFDDATAGSLVFTQSEASLEVLDGALVVELGRAGDLDEAALGDRTLFLEVVVNGSALAPRARIEAHPAAHFAHGADAAPLAHEATQVGTLTAAEAVPFDALATAGALPVAYSNLTGFPAAFADGDQGLEFTTSSQLSFSNGTLALAAGAIGSTEIADGTVGSSDLAAGAVGGAAIASGAVGSAQLATGAVQANNLVNGTITTRVLGATGATNQRRVYRVDNSNCRDATGTLSFDSDCDTVTTGCSAGYARNCSGTCVSIAGGFPTCANTAVGWVVFAP